MGPCNKNRLLCVTILFLFKSLTPVITKEHSSCIAGQLMSWFGVKWYQPGLRVVLYVWFHWTKPAGLSSVQLKICIIK